MFYEIARDGDPTPYELSRLRSYELTGRLHNVILEVFDLGTDIAFVLVLYSQAGLLMLPPTFDFYKAVTGDSCTTEPPGLEPKIFMQMAIASTVFIVLCFVYRSYMAIYQILGSKGDINSPFKVMWVTAGFVVSLIDPWNGAIMINSVVVHNRLECSDYQFAKAELRSDLMLILLEDFPQLCIQIAYGAYAGDFQRITVAWFVTLFITLLHFSLQVIEVIHLTLQLPHLKKNSEVYKEEHIVKLIGEL